MTSNVDLAQLYDDHAQALFAFLLTFTRSQQDTQDVLQEVFLKIARRPDLLHTVRDTRGFLLRLSHNLAVDLIRRDVAGKTRAHRVSSETTTLFAPSPDPDEAAFRNALAEAMEELPSDQRSVVHLRLWEARTFEEIAEILDIPQNTAASRYRYGIDKLSRRLRPLYEEIK